ncbi:MAG: GIY-YIG nuclease family protein [Spirochaetaceae bacterium]|nr:MAG: GIY-YIG nuclease family protein [Spirochaetaceae bacterium]
MGVVSIRTAKGGSAGVKRSEVPLDLEAVYAAHEDRGAYLLVIEVKRRSTLRVGSLGEIQFESGWYVYVGSGMLNLSARIARHHRKRKKLHWHIDYLLDGAETGDITSLPIRCRQNLECSLARDVSRLAAGHTPRFGCSDCSCTSHLLRFDVNPLQSRPFLDLLLHHRHSIALARSS